MIIVIAVIITVAVIVANLLHPHSRTKEAVVKIATVRLIDVMMELVLRTNPEILAIYLVVVIVWLVDVTTKIFVLILMLAPVQLVMLTMTA